jgi:plastocyanin/mono/diheme cytochrome c family protein
MALGRSLGWLALLLFVVLIAGALVVWIGIVDVSATSPSGPADRLLAYASRRSLRHHGPKVDNPLAHDAAAGRRGLALYGEMCVMCHGAPGVSPSEPFAGLNPPAPDLASPDLQAFSDGMLFRAIAQGIRSTGMPAFVPTHDEPAIWSLVAAVRHLPALTATEKATLQHRARAERPYAEGERIPRERGERPYAEGARIPRERGEPAPQPAPKADASPSRGKVHPVAMEGLKFVPQELQLHVGETVEWVNQDFVPHTATADDHSFDSGRLKTDQRFRLVAAKKGTFPYFCRFHVTMRGTLKVD